MCLQLNEHDDNTTVTNVMIFTNSIYNFSFHYNGLHEERLRELKIKILSKIEHGND